MPLPLPLGGIKDGTLRFILETIAKQFPVKPPALALPNAYKLASADLTLTTTAQDVAGCTYTTAFAGTFAVFGVFDFNITAAGPVDSIGSLSADGATQTAVAIVADAAGRASVAQNWIVTVGTGKVLKLQASKLINAGTSLAKQNDTTMTVIQIA